MERIVYLVVSLLLVGSCVYFIHKFLSSTSSELDQSGEEQDVFIKYPAVRYLVGIGVILFGLFMLMKIFAKY